MNDVFSRFDIVEGDALGYWYNRKNYLHPGRGTMGTSCQAVGRLDWLEIYIKNPETVKLLILRSEENWDKIIGRSLLWKLDDGNTFMDYIYTSNDSDDKVFKEYAKSKGWINLDESFGRNLTTHIKPGRLDAYPSVDTMNHWNPETGQISNKSFPGSEGIIWTNDGDDDDFEDFEDDDF
jgi:hypothetical protein